MSRARKVDANQGQIVGIFRALGARVFVSSGFGDGFPDLVVQYRYPRTGRLDTLLVEIKDGSKPPSARKLTPEQELFHSIFNCHIVDCESDVYTLLEINRGD